MIGNGCTNWTLDTNLAFRAMSFWHNLINKEFEDKLVENNCILPELTIDSKGGI